MIHVRFVHQFCKLDDHISLFTKAKVVFICVKRFKLIILSLKWFRDYEFWL